MPVMKKLLIASLFFISCARLCAQTDFKVGWSTYKTGVIVREYTYNIVTKDSLQFILADSAVTLCTADSTVSLTTEYPFREKCLYRSAHFYNSKKQLVKTEDYKDEQLLNMCEYKYDEKCRKCYQLEDNKVKGSTYKKTYEYASDRKSGDTIVSECAYFNGRVEFYTKSYYNRKNEKYKEVRLNDNNKDVVHIESYTYGANGKVKERSVYFPEWKVTKKFEEQEGNQLPKCFKTFPIPPADKITQATKVTYLKRLLIKNQAVISDKDCNDFEFKFARVNCEVVVRPTKVNNGRQAIIRLRERVYANP